MSTATAGRIKYEAFPACDIVWWNMNNGKRAGITEALDALEASGARLINLNECGGHWPVIRAWAKRNKFSVHTGTGDVGSASAQLIRHRSGSKSKAVKTIAVPWVGPQGKDIDGRVLLMEKALPAEGRRVMTIDVHQVWGPNRESNEDAKRAVVQQIRKWAIRNPAWDLYMGPDWNETRTSREPWSPLGTAGAIDGRILPGGHNVDYIVFRPALKPTAIMKARPAQPRVIVGGKMGSDHPAIGVSY